MEYYFLSTQSLIAHHKKTIILLIYNKFDFFLDRFAIYNTYAGGNGFFKDESTSAMPVKSNTAEVDCFQKKKCAKFGSQQFAGNGCASSKQ